jgi:hypothetical protein
VPKVAERNIAAMPTVGRGLELMMPYGKSRANVSRKASTVVIRSQRCSFLSCRVCGVGAERQKAPTDAS